MKKNLVFNKIDPLMKEYLKRIKKIKNKIIWKNNSYIKLSNKH